MADPTKYTPGYDFSNFQANTPNKPLPGDRLDIELADIAEAVDQTIDALKDIRRSDGALKNGVVTFESLADGVLVEVSDGVLTEAREARDEAVASAIASAASQTAAAASAVQAAASAVQADISADAAFVSESNAAATLAGAALRASNLSDLANAATARTNLGATAVGGAVFTAATAAAARAAIGAAAQADGYVKGVPVYLTSGTGATLGRPSGARGVIVEGVGGGGVGGSTTGGATGVAMAAAGGGGEYISVTLTTLTSDLVYSVAGAAAGSPGPISGGTTSFTINGGTWTALGGEGGGDSAATTATDPAPGGQGGTGGAGIASIRLPGGSASNSLIVSGVRVMPSVAGFAPVLGGGGKRGTYSINTNGVSGNIYGGGGTGGSKSATATNYTGGAGAAGVIRVTWLY